MKKLSLSKTAFISFVAMYAMILACLIFDTFNVYTISAIIASFSIVVLCMIISSLRR